MKPSTLNGKRILAIDDDPDLLEVLEEEILAAYPDLNVEKAFTFSQAIEKMTDVDYDAVILDIMSSYGFKLLELAQSRHLRVGLLTTYPILHERPRLPTQMAARAFLSKESLGDVVPFLDKIMDNQILNH
jgi:DNA-binding NtrC family response regulator